MKIAVQLNDDRNIIGTVTTSEAGAELQVKLFKNEGWTLVDSDPAFLVDEAYLWTIRDSDYVLVHISTNQTPDEENQNNITELTKGNLANKMTGAQLQTAVTALTKSNLQLTLDNTSLKADRDKTNKDIATQQQATTSLTKQLLDLQLKTATTEASK